MNWRIWILWAVLQCGLFGSISRAAAQSERDSGSEFARRCAEARSGQVVLDSGHWIEFRRGTGPLILAAPHGGKRASAQFPARTHGVRVADMNTDQLTRAIVDRLDANGSSAWMIVCHLQRKYLDPNRPLDIACAEDSPAVEVWENYQAAIRAAKTLVTEELGRGMFIEIHGHGHSIPRLELGYLLRASDYELPAIEFEKLAARCSLREIVERGSVSLAGLVRGESSLGAYLAKQGIDSVPSPKQPGPGKEPYFNGGWNTMTHGSRDTGTISSLQIEFHRKGMRDNAHSIANSAEKIAAALLQFQAEHYPSTPKR